MFNYEQKRILIWGKTAPELSDRHTETVCTGGVLEDGTPVRLYPIPFRYLEGEQKFHNYQWITAEIAKDLRDARPESHRVKENSIVCDEVLPSSADEWGVRGQHIFKSSEWQFDSLEDLVDRERVDKTSIGIVEPKEIIKVSIKNRTPEEKAEFDRKFADLLKENEFKRSQHMLFEGDYTVPELKNLPFVENRLQLHWRCAGSECKTHNTQVMDWGVIELQRKVGMEKARERLEEICDLGIYALKFYMGNIKSHPERFTIVGLWYPKRATDRLFV